MQSDVIALPGVTPSVAASLLEAEKATGIPADSIAIALYAESGLKPNAANRNHDMTIVAAGILQLTKGANLPGFNTTEALENITKHTIEWQIKNVVIPYFKRFGSIGAVSPGRLRVRMFLPVFANASEDTLAGEKDNHNKLPGSNMTYNDVYISNSGFDTDHSGSFTVGDVIANTESIGHGRGRVQPGTAAPDAALQWTPASIALAAACGGLALGAATLLWREHGPGRR